MSLCFEAYKIKTGNLSQSVVKQLLFWTKSSAVMQDLRHLHPIWVSESHEITSCSEKSAPNFCIIPSLSKLKRSSFPLQPKGVDFPCSGKQVEDKGSLFLEANLHRNCLIFIHWGQCWGGRPLLGFRLWCFITQKTLVNLNVYAASSPFTEVLTNENALMEFYLCPRIWWIFLPTNIIHITYNLKQLRKPTLIHKSMRKKLKYFLCTKRNCKKRKKKNHLEINSTPTYAYKEKSVASNVEDYNQKILRELCWNGYHHFFF